MRKIIPILVVAVVLSLTVFSSGCVQQAKKNVTVSSTDGLIIKEFYADASRYENTESIPLYLEVENVGGTTAEHVNITILGVPWSNQTCPTKSGGVGTCPQILADKMSPPDLSTTPPVPGDFVSRSWSLPAFSSLPEGIEQQVTITARVTYDYSSNGAVNVYVLGKKYYKTLLQQNKPIPTVKSVSNSRGPIHIDIERAGLPIIVDNASESNPKTVQLRIYIKNVGSGVPITGTKIGNMSVNISVIGTNVKLNKCEGFTTTGTGNQRVAYGTITLRPGGAYTLVCTANITSTPTLYDTIGVIMKTNYRYFIEKPITVTIVGTS